MHNGCQAQGAKLSTVRMYQIGMSSGRQRHGSGAGLSALLSAPESRVPTVCFLYVKPKMSASTPFSKSSLLTCIQLE
jgi:hypothetical protein